MFGQFSAFTRQRIIDEFHQAIHIFNLLGLLGAQALVCDLCPLPQTVQESAVRLMALSELGGFFATAENGSCPPNFTFHVNLASGLN